MTADRFVAMTPDGPITGSVSGSGPPLLLLHGGPALTDYMELLDGELAGWRAIRYQQRGLPPSATTGPVSVEQHVADAVAVLDALDIGQAVVLGHSWGGHLALHLALSRPDRVTGLVIVDALGAVDDGGLAEMGQNLVNRLTPASVPLFAEVAARLSGPAATDDDALASLSLLWPGYFAEPSMAPPIPPNLRTSVTGYEQTMASVAAQLADGFAQRLAAVNAPAVFVLGGGQPDAGQPGPADSRIAASRGGTAGCGCRAPSLA